ncbi:MAG: divergent polysaccharide deacetylase family protein, partial [Candidatus Acidiferrales bacterium]
MQPTKNGASTRLAADSVYISLTDPAQASALAQALTAIAQRHNLAITETTSPGVIRFDFSFHGVRTHAVHVVTPLAARAHAPAAQNRSSSNSSGGDNPRLAIIIDDLGYDRSAADAVLALGFPLTVSVLPHLPLSNEVAEEAQRRGDQVM